MSAPLFNSRWASDPALRRTPTLSEIAAGFPAGAAERAVFNELMFRLALSNDEIANAVAAAGIAVDTASDNQLADSILRRHRYVETQTFYVPGTYATLQEALAATTAMAIPSDVIIRIQVGPGDQTFDINTGPAILSHPYGNRIEIVGEPMTGAFPVEAEIVSSVSTTEATLRAKWPTRLVCTGMHGMWVLQGQLGLLKNFLIIGDGTVSDWAGVLAGEWQNFDGTGGLRAEDVYCHNFGGDGWRIHQSSRVSGKRVGASFNRQNGFRIANMSNVQISERFLSMRNLGIGALTLDNSFLELSTADSDISNNGSVGLSVVSNSLANLWSNGANAQRIKNNGAAGVFVSAARAILKNSTVTGNTTADFFAEIAASIQLISTPTGSPVYSPATNVVGNSNAIIKL